MKTLHGMEKGVSVAETIRRTRATGDWNADGEFDSSDFVVAFTDGGYEAGPRGSVAAVPEPSSLVLMLLAALPLWIVRCS
jgi:hypothetical protein